MTNFLFLSLPGGMEWVIILFVVLLLFGGKKIPELMHGLGKGIREFNNARNSIESEIKEGMREAEEEERTEKQLNSVEPPQISQMSDEALAEEMRRRAEAKQVN